MNAYRPDPAVRLLAVMTSVLYGAAWMFGGMVIVGVLALEFVAGTETRQRFSLGVTTAVELDDVKVGTAWGGTLRLEMDASPGSLRVPVGSAPLGFRLATYLGLAIIYGVFLRFLFQLRPSRARCLDQARAFRTSPASVC